VILRKLSLTISDIGQVWTFLDMSEFVQACPKPGHFWTCPDTRHVPGVSVSGPGMSKECPKVALDTDSPRASQSR
jgi:hypothetical protein